MPRTRSRFSFDRYSRLVFRVAERILRNPEEAEEVLQIVFLTIFRMAAKFESKTGRGQNLAVAIRLQPKPSAQASIKFPLFLHDGGHRLGNL